MKALLVLLAVFTPTAAASAVDVECWMPPLVEQWAATVGATLLREIAVPETGTVIRLYKIGSHIEAYPYVPKQNCVVPYGMPLGPLRNQARVPDVETKGL